VSEAGSWCVCSALQSHFGIIAWAWLPLMDDLVRANTECCVLLRPLGTTPLVAAALAVAFDFAVLRRFGSCF
jgi:hypothetical protein